MPNNPSLARDTLDIDWTFFGEMCRALAVHVGRDFDPDIVLGIAKAGVVPAAIIATMLRRPLATITIGRPERGAAPELREAPPEAARARRVLIVDGTCDRGDTFKLALNAVRTLQPADVRTATVFRTGAWQPDFQAFSTDKSIVLPWDRDIIENGTLVARDGG